MVIALYGMSIGFIGTLVVCLLLNYVALRRIKVDLDNATITRVARPFVFALWGGVLLTVIFWIQECIVHPLLALPAVINSLLYGFISAAGSIVATSVIYLLTMKALPGLGIQLVTTEQSWLLTQIPVASFAVLVGVYEGLAMPILQIWALAPQHYRVLIALLVGLSGGALSSLIIVLLAKTRVMNKHMWLKFSIPA